MTSIVRAHDESERGVVLIIVAGAMVVLIGMMALAIDASYGFVQNRRAQNATDFAASAAAQEIENSYYCDGLTQPSTQQIVGIIQNLVNDNDSAIGPAWSAQFLDSSGTSLGSFSPTNTPNPPPNGTCGFKVTATPTWAPFFAGIFGVHQLAGYASGSVGPKATQGVPVGILALNKAGPHEILGGGTGQFVVSGDIFLDTDVTDQPWSGSYGGDEWDDAIDAKTNSSLEVYGTIFSSPDTYNGESMWPLDQCFEPDGIQPIGPTSPSESSGLPPGVQLSCNTNNALVHIDYNGLRNDWPQFSDPLSASDAPVSPVNTTTGCPGLGPQTFGNVTQVPGSTTMLDPGTYTTPVDITTSAQFQDCPGGYTGIYNFDAGLSIDPPSGDSVLGDNIVIATQAPYPEAGNVPGSLDVNGNFQQTPGEDGNGAPCLPSATMTSAPSGRGNPEPETYTGSASPGTPCGGTNPTTYGVVAYTDKPIAVDPSMVGTGNNFSLMIGGGGSVSLTGPTSGAYGGLDGKPGVVLYQDPQTQANYGFDAEPGDSADIQINGVVYNASLAQYGTNPTVTPEDYWDGVGGGIPFYAGGTLQTGYGAGWASPPGPAPSSGSVQLTGTAIVDDFNTDGDTSINIVGEPYSLPGGGFLSLIG